MHGNSQKIGLRRKKTVENSEKTIKLPHKKHGNRTDQKDYPAEADLFNAHTENELELGGVINPFPVSVDHEDVPENNASRDRV